MAGYVQELIETHNVQHRRDVSILVVGLGNRQVTPDALGPNVDRSICDCDQAYCQGVRKIRDGNAACRSAQRDCAPGVMGQTGMETVEMVRGVVQETKPDLDDCGGRAGGPQQSETEPYHPDRRYRNSSRHRSGQSTEAELTKESIGSTGDRDRSSDGGGRGDHCQ